MEMLVAMTLPFASDHIARRESVSPGHGSAPARVKLAGENTQWRLKNMPRPRSTVGCVQLSASGRTAVNYSTPPRVVLLSLASHRSQAPRRAATPSPASPSGRPYRSLEVPGRGRERADIYFEKCLLAARQ